MLTVLEVFKEQLTGNWITSGNDVQYKIFIVDRVLYLLFQGSVGKEDWKQNFRFWIAPYRDMKPKWYAHKGFVHNWKSVQDEVIKKIESLIEQEGIIKIVVSGYSHGAGVGTLAFEDVQFRWPSMNAQGWMFGSPRVIWLPFKSIKKRFTTLYRFEVRGDIVAHLPFIWMGYRHVGALYELGKKVFWHLTKKYHLYTSYIQALEEE
jgi:hypothetical protein